MRGRGGPKPETKKEIEERENDPTAEDIVGAENIVDVSNGRMDVYADGVPVIPDPEFPPLPQGYTCANCTFRSNLLSEMQEHVDGTGHGKFDTEALPPVQPELFSTPGTIKREIKVPLEPAFVNSNQAQLADFYQRALDIKDEKKEADASFNLRLKTIDERMQEIARVLKNPYTYEKVECAWTVIDGENKRELRRIDTGEVIETQPLSQEDREAEMAKAQADNATEEQESVEEEDEVTA